MYQISKFRPYLYNMKKINRITEKDINRLINIIKENNELRSENQDWGWFDRFGFDKEGYTKGKTQEELESLRWKNVKSGDVLIIHPDDRTTDFLKPTYSDLDATVLTKPNEFFNLAETMKRHNRIIMMGHGSPSGLFMPKVEGIEEDENGELFEYTDYAINDSYSDILRENVPYVFGVMQINMSYLMIYMVFIQGWLFLNFVKLIIVMLKDVTQNNWRNQTLSLQWV